jgi:hypothetical protein
MDRWESWWRACSGAIDDEEYRVWFAVGRGYKAQCTESRRSSRRCFSSSFFLLLSHVAEGYQVMVPGHGGQTALSYGRSWAG